MSEVKLKLSERLSLASILPGEGKFEDLIVVEDIKEKVSINQEELDLYEIQSLANGSIAWSAEKTNGVTFDYSFTERESEMIKIALEKLDKEEKLHTGLIELYRLFVK